MSAGNFLGGSPFYRPPDVMPPPDVRVGGSATTTWAQPTGLDADTGKDAWVRIEVQSDCWINTGTAAPTATTTARFCKPGRPLVEYLTAGQTLYIRSRTGTSAYSAELWNRP